VEFVGSGKHHPILPLIPVREVERQIHQNAITNRHFLGREFAPKGFFPPEMCYSRDIIRPIAESGHRWLVLSGVACPVAWPMDVVHTVRSGEAELAVLFRDDILSNRISFQEIDGRGFVEHLRGLGAEGRDTYVVTAMDAETFGHHIENWEQLFLAEVYEALRPQSQVHADVRQAQPLAERHRALLRMPDEAELGDIRIVTISEVAETFPRGRVVEPRASSWSTTAEDLAQGNPYPLWRAPGNHVHTLQWQHVELCLEVLYRAEAVADTERSRHFTGIARALMDPALHSCQFWWASRRPHWDINLIARGLYQQEQVLLNAYKAINLSTVSEEVKRESYYRVVAARDVATKLTDQLYWD
jgi:alpha-amylase/alpha-mannosidase (GH57 family)